MKTHNEFMKEVKEATREPTLPELTKDALSELDDSIIVDKFGRRER